MWKDYLNEAELAELASLLEAKRAGQRQWKRLYDRAWKRMKVAATARDRS
jgi:hypothetical protein